MCVRACAAYLTYVYVYLCICERVLKKDHATIWPRHAFATRLRFRHYFFCIFIFMWHLNLTNLPAAATIEKSHLSNWTAAVLKTNATAFNQLTISYLMLSNKTPLGGLFNKRLKSYELWKLRPALCNFLLPFCCCCRCCCCFIINRKLRMQC